MLSNPEPVYMVRAAITDPTKVLAEKSRRIYEAMAMTEQVGRDDFAALKIHFGEKGNIGFIKPAWIRPIASALKRKSSRIYITDTNTLYVGSRSNAPEHLQLARGHGFSLATLGIPVVIADGLIGREVEKISVAGKHVREAKIASAFIDTDFLVCLSHFTGHILTGFGAAIKNLGMGCASRLGKLEQHSGIHPHINKEECKFCRKCFESCPAGAIAECNGKAEILEESCIGCGECLVVCPTGAIKLSWDSDKDRIQEKIAEYAKAVMSLFPGRAVFLNYLLHITKDCDCMSHETESFIDDVGILGSRDPVALDRASVDLVTDSGKVDPIAAHHNIDWSIQLRHGEAMKLGTQQYKLIELD